MPWRGGGGGRADGATSHLWPALVVARRWQEVPPEIRAEVRAMSEEVHPGVPRIVESQSIIAKKSQSVYRCSTPYISCFAFSAIDFAWDLTTFLRHFHVVISI